MEPQHEHVGAPSAKLSRELARMYAGLFDAFEAAATEQETELASRAVLRRAAAPMEADLLLLLCRGVIPLMRVPYAERGQSLSVSLSVTQQAQRGGVMLRALQRRLRATAEI